MAKAVPPVDLTAEQIEAIQKWEAAKAQLETIKALELEHRLNIIATMPFNADKEEGDQTLKLGAGWKLAINKTINYTVDKDTQKVVEIIGKLNAVNPGAAAELIRWEAVLSTGAYKKLTDEEKLIVAAIVTMKPGTPTLSLKAPAAPKA